ncbi:ketopantoate reductase PanE/ApbA C terminal-domain-containing protein [Mycena latifolia]|nr:ketopantoate reductase PanE/ApbA C terminal-domain-containing protein [Mycena latifolia]
MLDVLVFGPGAIGSIYAYILQAGSQVRISVVARSNAVVLKEKGLSLRSLKFGDHAGIRFNEVHSDCREAAKSGRSFAYVICTNKAVSEMQDILKPVIGPDTSIVLVQNGVGQEEPLHMAFPTTTIIPCVVIVESTFLINYFDLSFKCWTGGRTLDVGVVQMFTRKDTLVLGVDWSRYTLRLRPKKDLDVLVDILTKSNAGITVSEDIQVDRWLKVIWNSAWNSLTTLTQISNTQFMSTSPNAIFVARSIFSEGINVAKAKGFAIPENTLDEMMTKYNTLNGMNSSMRTDALNMKPMEVESILGYPMREGLRLGVPVPTLTTIYALLKALDWNNAQVVRHRL